jgi:hypothetical protein
MSDLQSIVSCARLLQIGALLFSTFFFISILRHRSWKRALFGVLWSSLFFVCVVYLHGGYNYAKDMIFKTSMTVNEVCLLREYIDYGVDVNIQDHKGMTPLMYSVYCNSIPNVKFLLSRGADPDIKDIYGKSARDRAIEYNLKDMKNLLK